MLQVEFMVLNAEVGESMKAYRTKWWSVSVPNDWICETIEGSDLLYSEEGVGALQIKTQVNDYHVGCDELRSLAKKDIDAGAKLENVELGDFSGFKFNYRVDSEYWCEWYLCAKQTILLASYNCENEDKGVEEEEINALLDSLRWH